MRVMDQAVNERRSKPVISKDSIPLRELQIGCNDEAFALIAVRDHLEQQLGSVLVKRYKADLINHNEFRFLQRTEKAVQRSLGISLQEDVCQLRVVKKRTCRPSWQAFNAMAVARCVFPVPTAPMKIRFSLGAKK